MVPSVHCHKCNQFKVSVLALSSRFDGQLRVDCFSFPFSVSVLALSSRFDGPVYATVQVVKINQFQYSLCRVVLMVI